MQRLGIKDSFLPHSLPHVPASPCLVFPLTSLLAIGLETGFLRRSLVLFPDNFSEKPEWVRVNPGKKVPDLHTEAGIDWLKSSYLSQQLP